MLFGDHTSIGHVSSGRQKSDTNYANLFGEKSPSPNQLTKTLDGGNSELIKSIYEVKMLVQGRGDIEVAEDAIYRDLIEGKRTIKKMKRKVPKLKLPPLPPLPT